MKKDHIVMIQFGKACNLLPTDTFALLIVLVIFFSMRRSSWRRRRGGEEIQIEFFMVEVKR